MTTLPVRKSWYAPWRVRGVTFAVGLVVLCLIPNLVGDHLAIWSSFLADAILLLSLGLLVRVSGQISLCHLAFAAVGAASFAHFTDSFHLPWLLALLCAMLVAVPVGAIVAIPAIRLSGLFLALATLGFGILLQYLFYSTNLMFGLTTSGIPAPGPDVSVFGLSLASDKGFYYVLLIAAALSTAVIMVIQRSRMGRLLGALADSPLALETQGATTNVIKVLVFCISAAFASLAGALIAVEFHYAVGANYDPFLSLVYVALVVIAVGGEPWYALLAALGVSIIPGYFTSNNVTTYLQIFFGVMAATYAVVQSRTATVPLRVRQVLDRLGGRRPEQAVTAERIGRSIVDAAAAEEKAARLDSGLAAASAVAANEGAAIEPVAARAGLHVRGLSVRFGGVSAVQEVSLTAPMGTITGLVGPNGAGKTTTFNACSGLVRPSEGEIMLHGRDVTSLGPAGRSRCGLGRSFQRVELFSSLTVRENVALGREASLAGANPARQLVSGPGQRATVRRAVEDAIELTGIGPLADLQAGLLPTGQRRMVELARVLAGPFDLLLLDEPSSGLDANETRRFGDIVTGAVAERGVGVLLVEHDMALVRQVCQNIYVLDFGRLVFEGPAPEMLASPIVRNAYLGSEGGMADAVGGGSSAPAAPPPQAAVLGSEWCLSSRESRPVTARRSSCATSPSRSPTRGRGAPRSQRGGQDDDPARRLRPDQADQWSCPAPRGGRDGAQALCHGPAGPLPPARRARHLPLAHGQGEHRLELSQGQGEGVLGEGGRPVPGARRAPRAAGGQPQWRRATDALAGTGLSHESGDRRGRRGVARPLAAARGPGVRRTSTDRRRWHRLVVGRTVRDPCARARGHRLPHEPRPDRVFGPAADLRGEEVFERYLGIEVGP